LGEAKQVQLADLWGILWGEKPASTIPS